MRIGTKNMQGTWRRFIALSLSILSAGCAYFDAKSFFTTHPLYYGDLAADIAVTWEFFIWDETGKLYERFPCAAAARRLEIPKTTAIHAFNKKGMYNIPNHVVTYPIGEMDVLYHEYIHARNSVLDQQCLSEVFAQHATKRWSSGRSKRLETLFAYGPK